MRDFDAVIVGGGILGVSISYFLSFLNRSKKIALIEQAHSVAFHASRRNTGKVHAPYLYDPERKKLFAKSSFHGYEMWETYAKLKGLPFKKDGVIKVALDEKGGRSLERYLRWGIRNGLGEGDIELTSKEELKKIEPEIRCESALCVHKDASVDYSQLADSVMADSRANGTRVLLDARVTGIKKDGDAWIITINKKDEIRAKFLINAAGGESIDIAHGVGVAERLTDVHFRGEYWKAPKEYNSLTKSSVYSVPEFPEYPFLDPHWIQRVDGSCEIGPNAVPVFGPYGYGAAENLKEFVPKMLEMLGSGAKRAILDRQFQELAVGEIRSSLSKTAMVDRVRRFLPGIDADRITEKGTAGIRSSVIDEKGKFVPDIVLEGDEMSFHILNYNSPGATGVLAFSAHIIGQLHEKGLFSNEVQDAECGPWKFSRIIEKMQ